MVGDELGAVGLPLRRESPGADERDLPAQEVRAHIERDLTALAYVAGRSPGSCAPPPGAGPRLACARGVERLVCAFAVSEFTDRLDRIVRACVDHLVCAERAR